MTMRNVWGRGFALGNIPTTDQQEMLSTLELGFSDLDALAIMLNEARAAGIDVTPYQVRRDELRAALTRLSDRVGLLESSDDIAAWTGERIRLLDEVSVLREGARAFIRQQHASSKVNIGIWVGAGVLGAVGTILLVRWYGKKRRRR